MVNLYELNSWERHLGLLPINLFLEQEKNKSFILHNGGKGDFCLSFLEETPEDILSRAWSSNTNNYLTVDQKYVNIYNWKKKTGEPEKVLIRTVQENYLKFYDYLTKKNFRSGSDITPFVLNIFREIRNLLDEVDGGKSSLNLLLNLLAASEEGVDLKNLDKSKWGLSDEYDFTHLSAALESYLQDFNEGTYDLKPNVELMVRHSAGMLFQEAHQEVTFFDKQMSLFGGKMSGTLHYSKKSYSSVHYTPTYVARSIVENSLSQLNLSEKKNLKIFDPACGTSIFLLEALKQLSSKNYTGNVEVIGWDISESAIDSSRFLLAYEKREWGKRLTVNLSVVEDSLKEKWETDYDLVLMNPPYLSWELMTSEAREAVKESLQENFQEKPNIASAFFYKASIHVAEKGVFGCLVPSTILSNNSYRKLRASIEELSHLSFVGRLGSHIFERALADVSIVIGSKPKRQEQSIILWTDNKKEIVPESLHELRKLHYNNSSYTSTNAFSIYHHTFPFFEKGGDWTPISRKNNELLGQLNFLLTQNELKRAHEVFTVKQGIRTGNNNVFKIHVDQYAELSLAEQKLFKPALDNASIVRGSIAEVEDYLWYPYKEDGLIITSEKDLSEKAPIFYKKGLLPNKKVLMNRARKGLKDWWTLSEHRSWLRKQEPRLVSTEFGDSNSFAFDRNGEYLIERGNGWILKNKSKDEDIFFFYLAIFSSSTFNNLLSIFARPLLKGWDLGGKSTRNIPIPKYKKNDHSELVLLGRKLHDGNFFESSILDKSVETAYSIS